MSVNAEFDLQTLQETI